MNKTSALVATTALSALLVGTFSAPAVAKHGNDVIKRGNCSGSADWKVKVGPEDGRLEVEGEIDSNRVGQRWTWTLRHNGTLIASGARQTAGRSGSFEVRRTPRNLAGTDTLVFRAVRPATGQVCRGVASF